MEKLKQIIDGGESITVEFKQSKGKLNKDVFETVCAFLNRNGGHLFLGVRDDGEIIGIKDEEIEKIKKEFVTSLNNSNKISPTAYISITGVEIKGKNVLYAYIPESSQVHKCSGKIYDRNEDGDFNISENTTLLSNMYIRKQSTYIENKIFPYAKLEDLRTDLISRIRQMASNQRDNHPWISMDDINLLKSAGLYLLDPQTGTEGITLAGILLFGKDELIRAALPHHRTDAILRNKIFREAVSNMLIHREFSNPYPAKIIIEKHRVYIENATKSRIIGEIDPFNFSPYPKNPVLAKFFSEIGWAEELGSGIRNIFRYTKIYSGADPKFIEDDVFKTIIPLDEQATPQATPQAKIEDHRTHDILEFCRSPKSRKEIQDYLGIKDRRHFSKNILSPLLRGGLLKLSIPSKPTSPNQKYYSEVN